MRTANFTCKLGFTIVELTITLAVALILVLGMGAVLSDSWKAWHSVHDRIYSDIFEDSFVVRRFFDATIRKSNSGFTVGPLDHWIKVYYYANDDSTFLDRYRRLFTDNEQLRAEYGQRDEDGIESTIELKTICENVSSCNFSVAGQSAQMALELDNGQQNYVVVTSAVAHN